MTSRDRFQRMQRRAMFAAALLLVLQLPMIEGCATRNNATPVRAGDHLAFVDIDSFDAALARDLRGRREAVTVRFTSQQASVNALPERLQKWLSAVHRHGGGVTVETVDGYASKNILGIVSALVAGYRLVQDSLPTLLGRDYRAVIIVQPDSGAVERLDFVRTVTSPAAAG